MKKGKFVYKNEDSMRRVHGFYDKTLAYWLLIVASDNDIFFPADRVFMRAKEIFKGPVTTVRIDSKHLPSEEAMTRICGQTAAFLKENA